MFNVEQAKQEGYSDEEIAKYLANTRNYKLNDAVKEGYSHKEIIDHLTSREPVPKQTQVTPNRSSLPFGLDRLSEVPAAVGETAAYLGGQVSKAGMRPLFAASGISQGLEAITGSETAGIPSRAIEQAFTYQPKTETAKNVVGAIEAPFRWLNEAGDVTADWVREKTQPFLGETGATLAATTAGAIPKFLPYALIGKQLLKPKISPMEYRAPWEVESMLPEVMPDEPVMKVSQAVAEGQVATPRQLPWKGQTNIPEVSQPLPTEPLPFRMQTVQPSAPTPLALPMGMGQPPEIPRERVTGTAILMKDGTIYTRKDFPKSEPGHAGLFYELPYKQRQDVADISGYVTDKGRYLTEQEAREALYTHDGRKLEGKTDASQIVGKEFQPPSGQAAPPRAETVTGPSPVATPAIQSNILPWMSDPTLVADAKIAAKKAGVLPSALEYVGLQKFAPLSNDAMHLWNVMDPNSPKHGSTIAGNTFSLPLGVESEVQPVPPPLPGKVSKGGAPVSREEEVYHVSPYAKQIREEGIIRKEPPIGNVGLSQALTDKFVSVTTKKEVAELIRREMSRVSEVQLSQEPTVDLLKRYAKEDINRNPEYREGIERTLNETLDFYRDPIEQGEKNWYTTNLPTDLPAEQIKKFRKSMIQQQRHDMFQEYLRRRNFNNAENIDLNDPAFFGKAEDYAKYKPEDVEIITLPKKDIRVKTDLSDGILGELRIGEDVPLGGVPETISGAAIQLNDGRIISAPGRAGHQEAWNKLTEADKKNVVDDSGWVTSKGRYISTPEAIKLMGSQETYDLFGKKVPKEALPVSEGAGKEPSITDRLAIHFPDATHEQNLLVDRAVKEAEYEKFSSPQEAVQKKYLQLATENNLPNYGPYAGIKNTKEVLKNYPDLQPITPPAETPPAETGLGKGWTRVYHGTPEEGIKGDLVYFADKPEIAKIFAESPTTGKVGKVYPVDIKIENPYYAEGSQFIENAAYHPELVEPLKKQGYDGVIYKNEKTGHTEYLVFSQKQIKRAETPLTGEDIAEPSSYLYHGTPAKNLDSIKSRGLDSRLRERNDWEEGDKGPQEQELLYFERGENQNWGSKKAVQLRINEDMLPRGVRVEEDQLRRGEFYAYHGKNESFTIPPEAIEFYNKKSNRWESLTDEPTLKGKKSKEVDILQWTRDKGGIDPKAKGADIFELTQRESGFRGKNSLLNEKTGRAIDELAQEAEWEGIVPPGTGTEGYAQMLKDKVQGGGKGSVITEDFIQKAEAEWAKDQGWLREETKNNLTTISDDEIIGWKEEKHLEGWSEKDIARGFEEAQKALDAEEIPTDIEGIKQELSAKPAEEVSPEIQKIQEDLGITKSNLSLEERVAKLEKAGFSEEAKKLGEIPEKVYDDALNQFRQSSRAFTKIRDDYRAKKIGDEEFLSAKQEFDTAQKVFDNAETKFIEAKNKPKPKPKPTLSATAKNQFALPGIKQGLEMKGAKEGKQTLEGTPLMEAARKVERERVQPAIFDKSGLPAIMSEVTGQKGKGTPIVETPKSVGGKVYYHGTDKTFNELDFGKRKSQGIFGQEASKSQIIFLSENKKDAEFFSAWRGTGEVRVIEVPVSPTAKMLDLSISQGNKGYLKALEQLQKIDKEAADSIDEGNSTVQQELEDVTFVNRLKENGYDGIRFDEAEGHGISVAILNKNVIHIPSTPPEGGGAKKLSVLPPGMSVKPNTPQEDILPVKIKAKSTIPDSFRKIVVWQFHEGKWKPSIPMEAMDKYPHFVDMLGKIEKEGPPQDVIDKYNNKKKKL